MDGHRVKRLFTELIGLHKIQICKQLGQQRLSAVAAVGWFPCAPMLHFWISERVSMKEEVGGTPTALALACSMCACPWSSHGALLWITHCGSLLRPACPTWSLEVQVGWNHNSVISCPTPSSAKDSWIIRLWLGRDLQRSSSSSPVPWAGTSGCWKSLYVWHIPKQQ